jgi:hypothetical protein
MDDRVSKRYQLAQSLVKGGVDSLTAKKDLCQACVRNAKSAMGIKGARASASGIGRFQGTPETRRSFRCTLSLFLLPSLSSVPVENTAVTKKDEKLNMARNRELLSLLDIAEETGISYPTLRNYVIKFGDQIPSVGSGRTTRYPRQAVKVFQRLRKESKPGRKPASALAAQAAAPAPAASPQPVQQAPVAQVRPAVSAPVAPAAPVTASVDTSGIERELAGIRMQLQRIADAWTEALQRGVSLPVAAAAETAPVAGPEKEKQEKAEEPAAAAPQAETKESTPSLQNIFKAREAFRDLEAGRNSQSYGGRRQGRDFSPKVPGRKGPRPD